MCVLALLFCNLDSISCALFILSGAYLAVRTRTIELDLEGPRSRGHTVGACMGACVSEAAESARNCDRVI